jgi:hypothetical protein
MNLPPSIASRHSTEDGAYEVTYYYITTVDACGNLFPVTHAYTTRKAGSRNMQMSAGYKTNCCAAHYHGLHAKRLTHLRHVRIFLTYDKPPAPLGYANIQENDNLLFLVYLTMLYQLQ